MIPETITQAHVLEALTQIDSSTVPASRQAIDYDLVHHGKRYPPKFVISVAAKHASGAELEPERFTSIESNSVLKKLGFDIVRRERLAAVGAESDAEAVRAVFERLVPDATARRLCAEIFAESIDRVQTAGEARWEITLQKDLIRLNAGRVMAFDVQAQDAFLGVWSSPDRVDGQTMLPFSRSSRS